MKGSSFWCKSDVPYAPPFYPKVYVSVQVSEIWPHDLAEANTCAGGALRLQVPSTVQIDFFDVIFRNNTAQSSRDIWADLSQSTTINVHLICITDLQRGRCSKLHLASI